MNIIERFKAETPKFYKILRNIGLGMAASGGILVASPIAIPAISQSVTTNSADG